MGLIARSSRLYKMKFNGLMAENNIDLSSEMCGVLAILWEADGLHLQELAYTLKKDKGGMTKIIDSLAKRGVVRRIEDDKDRRKKKIMLTKEGKQLQEKAVPLIDSLRENNLNHISDEELDVAERILSQIVSNLEKTT